MDQDERFAFSTVSHIDSRDTLKFCLRLRRPQDFDPGSILDKEVTKEQVQARIADGRAAAQRRVSMAGAPSSGASASGASASGASTGRKSSARPRSAARQRINVGKVTPKARVSRCGCDRPECIKVDKWSWHLEAENEKLRSMLTSLLEERRRSGVKAELHAGDRSRVASLHAAVRERDAEIAELKQQQAATQKRLDQATKKARELNRARTESLMDLASAQARIDKLEATLKHRGAAVVPASAPAPARKKEAEDQDDDEDKIVPSSGEVPRTYQHTGSWGIISDAAAAALFKRRKVKRRTSQGVTDVPAPLYGWSCCLQDDKLVGCTVPPPPIADDKDELCVEPHTSIPLDVTRTGKTLLDAHGTGVMDELAATRRTVGSVSGTRKRPSSAHPVMGGRRSAADGLPVSPLSGSQRRPLSAAARGPQGRVSDVGGRRTTRPQSAHSGKPRYSRGGGANAGVRSGAFAK